MKPILAAVLISLALPATAPAQAADYTSIERIMTELYAAVTREPGAPFEWDRLRAIMHPRGIMVPQPAQAQGETRVLDVEEFITWIDAGWDPIIGTPSDHGFFERQLNLEIERYGDIANVFTTYEKGPWEPRQIIGRGINAVQLIRRDGRWWVLSITWDEENTAGPLPAEYSGS